MKIVASSRIKRLKRKQSIRKKIFGTSKKPRLTVFRSNKYISAQLIDDIAGTTLVFASSSEKELAEKLKSKKDREAAKVIGKIIAERAVKKGIKDVVFDRNGYLFHGRVKILADSARESGLIF
jgi:large subunit ribosomal protein L18